MDKEALADTLAVIRSLVIIKKQLTTLKEINAEYREMEGENIPFKDFGYQNAFDMLHRSNQFNLQRQPNGEVIISAKLSKKDEHMAKLVQETTNKKNSTAKRKFAPVSAPKAHWPQKSAKLDQKSNFQSSGKRFSRSTQNLSGHMQNFSRSMQNLQGAALMYKAPERKPMVKYQSNWNLHGHQQNGWSQPQPLHNRNAQYNSWNQIPQIQQHQNYQDQRYGSCNSLSSQQNHNQFQDQRYGSNTSLSQQQRHFQDQRYGSCNSLSQQNQFQDQRYGSCNSLSQQPYFPNQRNYNHRWNQYPQQQQNGYQDHHQQPQFNNQSYNNNSNYGFNQHNNQMQFQQPFRQQQQYHQQNQNNHQQQKYYQNQYKKPQQISEPASINWKPLSKEQMERHPIVQPEIKLKVKSVVVKVIKQEPKKEEPVKKPVEAPRNIPVITKVFDIAQNTRKEVQERKPPVLQPVIPKESPRVVTPPAKPKVAISVKPSLQSRLQIRPIDTLVEAKSDVDSGLSEGSPYSSHADLTESTENIPVKLAPNEDPITKITAICESLKFAAPTVRVLNSDRFVVCNITVDGKTFSATTSTVQEAKKEAALVALNHLKQAEMRKNYPVIQEDNHKLALRLHALLLLYPQGVMERSFPEIFQKATKMSLPGHWTRIIATYKNFFTIDSGPIAHVFYAKPLTEQKSSCGDDVKPLPLPWNEPHWNLFVTSIVSSTMIWARLIGPEFSKRFDNLLTDIELLMKDPRHRKTPDSVMVHNMYLVQRQSFWYRVRCQEVDTEGKRFLAFYVDQGNEEWLPIESVYLCGEPFQALPGQATLFTLHGLECMEENPNAKPVLAKMLQDKTVVAEIQTIGAAYTNGSRISAVFYDTTTAEDINLCDQLFEEISKAGKAPQLKKTGFSQFVITSVSDRGDVFGQIPGSGQEYVKCLIEKVVEDKELLQRHRGLKENTKVDAPTRYLIFDRERSLWARAVLKVRHPNTDEMVMHCLDSGLLVEVKQEDIYQLKPMSVALNKYPALAIKCVLYDIPRLDPRVICRMKGLLEPDSVTLAKVIVIPELLRVPQVKLYQRHLVNKNDRVIVCINETLRMENDLEASFSL